MYKTVTNVSLEEANSRIISVISPLEFEQVDLLNANGRVLAEDIIAGIDVPPFDRSALDGYAVKAIDTEGASKESPVELTVIDEVFAGSFSEKTIKSGEAVRIMTGALMPAGSDCIIAQENTDYGDKTVKIFMPHTPYDNYSQQGEDIKKDTLVIKKGEKIRYTHQGVIASVGISHIKAVKLPKIVLLFTGDELAPLGSPLSRGKIYNSVLSMLFSRLIELGIQPYKICHSTDDSSKLSELIIEMSEEADLIITTGGVSVGKKDILPETLRHLKAELIFQGLDFKPGSPAIFSLYKGVPILSLSGNPFAAITTFELLARTVLHEMTGDSGFKTKRVKGVFYGNFHKKSVTRRFIRGIYQNGNVSIPRSDTPSIHSSMVIGSMLDCNCLIDIEAGNAGLNSGNEVNVILLD